MKLNRSILNIVFLFLTIFFCQANNSKIITQDIEVDRLFDDKFKERYSSDKFNYEGEKVTSGTSFKFSTRTGDYSDYEGSEIRIKEDNNQELTFFNSKPISFVFYGLLILAIGFIVYALITKEGGGLFSSRKNQKLNVHNEITSKNIEETDINTLIQKAEQDNDYRLAIRYYYLLILKTLTLKKIITFEDDKTNAEYLNELNNKPFSKNFAYASYLYNYIWYGKFPVDIKQYNNAKHNFVALLNQVN